MRFVLTFAILFGFQVTAADKVSERVREFVKGVSVEERMEAHDQLILEFVKANASTLNLEEFLFLEQNVKLYAVIKDILHQASIRQTDPEAIIRILEVNQKSLPQDHQLIVEISAITFLGSNLNQITSEQCLAVVREMTFYSAIQQAIIVCGGKSDLTYKQLVQIIKLTHERFEYAQDRIEEVEKLVPSFIERNKATLSFVDCMKLNDVVKFYRIKDSINSACTKLP